MFRRLAHLLNWDFIRMGKGIEARYARCADYWEPHLSCTRSFIDAHARPGGRLAILGAGRLLDVDLTGLLSRFHEIHLFDADPTVLKTWRRMSGSLFRDRVIPRVMDITGSLHEWSAGLAQARRHHRLAEYLQTLCPRNGLWESEGFDGVISLNLSGQIPIYWRDRVLSVAPVLSDVEETALVDSMARLQMAHVRAVRERARAWSIIITDTEYYTYTVDRSEWDVEPAFHGESLKELHAPIAGVERTADSRWLWHLIPQFIESEEEGTIHKVEAFAWRAGAR